MSPHSAEGLAGAPVPCVDTAVASTCGLFFTCCFTGSVWAFIPRGVSTNHLTRPRKGLHDGLPYSKYLGRPSTLARACPGVWPSPGVTGPAALPAGQTGHYKWVELGQPRD